MTFRDPFHRLETPYDLLRLDPDASNDDIQRAFADFIRAVGNRKRISDALQARQQLSSPYDRAVIDLWFYTIGQPDVASDDAVQRLEADLSRPRRAPRFAHGG